jgi:NTE family protein
MNINYKTMGTKQLKDLLVILALAVAPVMNATAQSYHSALDNHREKEDLRVETIRHKLDSIKKAENRPTVALVLSGGGAKGAAHVGVIRYLESIGMPVDIVMGTSMGGLVGGIYALGYNPDQLDSLIRSIDWDMALSDKVPRDYLSYTTIKYKEKYALSFPFFYDVDEYKQMKESGQRDIRRVDDIHLGAGNADASNMVKDNLLGSLPSGMVYGQNVSNILSSLSVGYQDETDFYDLPIPFLCVATDLVSGTAKIWTKGKLNTALRSTMSIPGLFAPVRVDGMVLVDGGMRNNYPTDLAKKVGADIVIGVDLSSGFKDYNQINNLADIINTGIDMLGRSSFENNVSIPDVNIKPDLHEYNMMSFDDASIDTIINRGYTAALAVAGELDSIKTIVGHARKALRNDPADDIRAKKVLVSGVEILGVNDKESLYLMNKIKVGAGSRMGNAEIEDAEATIFGTNAFDYVNYELAGDEEPYRLKFNCKRGPVCQLGLGGRFDTEEIVSVLVNVGLGVHKLQGSSLDFTGKVGTNPKAELVYSYITPNGLSFNAMSGVRYTDRNSFSIGENRFRINFFDLRQEIYLSNIRWSKFFLKTGLRNDYYKISSLMAEQVTGDYDVNQLSNDYFTFFVNARRDSFDNAYIPTRGRSIGISYDWIFGGGPNSFNNFHAIQFDAKRVAGGEKFAFIPSVNIRYLIGDEVPVPFTNTIGGSMAGRYLDQQIPFIGINNAAAMQKILGVLRADLRVKLLKNNYLSAIANYAVSCDEISEFKNFEQDVSRHFGCGLQYTYNSIIGPLAFNVHWSSFTHKVGMYFSLGFDF